MPEESVPIVRATVLTAPSGVRRYAVRTLSRVTQGWATEVKIGEGATGSVFRSVQEAAPAAYVVYNILVPGKM
jgi:hypothetical protein